MYGNAKAVAAIAGMAGRVPVTREYRDKVARLKDLVDRRLWNPDASFYETRSIAAASPACAKPSATPRGFSTFRTTAPAKRSPGSS